MTLTKKLRNLALATGLAASLAGCGSDDKPIEVSRISKYPAILRFLDDQPGIMISVKPIFLPYPGSEERYVAKIEYEDTDGNLLLDRVTKTVCAKDYKTGEGIDCFKLNFNLLFNEPKGFYPPKMNGKDQTYEISNTSKLAREFNDEFKLLKRQARQLGLMGKMEE